MNIARGGFDKKNMLVSSNVKMAIIRLTCHPDIIVSVIESTVVVSPVILVSNVRFLKTLNTCDYIYISGF